MTRFNMKVNREIVHRRSGIYRAEMDPPPPNKPADVLNLGPPLQQLVGQSMESCGDHHLVSESCRIVSFFETRLSSGSGSRG